MGACEGAFPPQILRKQRRPSALQTMNCTPADYRLQKSVGQTTDRNRATLPSLFGMKFTQVHQPRIETTEICKQNVGNNSVAFTYNGTER